MTRLSTWLGMDHSTLVRNLRPLKQSGLVSSRPGSDRRTRELTLTEKGLDLLARAIPVWRRAQQSFLDLYGEERWSRTLSDLQRAHRVASQLVEEDTAAAAAAAAANGKAKTDAKAADDAAPASAP